MLRNKKIDFLIVVLILLGASTLSFFLRPKNIPLGILYLGLPSLYLFIRQKKNYKKIFWGVIIFGVIFGTVFDFILTINKAWIAQGLSIPWMLFGVWPVDDVFGYVFMALFIFVFYEHFIDDERHKKLSKRHAKMLLLSLLVLGMTMFAYFVNPDFLKISHVYLWGGLAAIAFPIIFSIFNPHIIKKLSVLAVFFFFVWLLLEIVGVKIGGWAFPGSGYIGYASIFGVTFPIEEIIFWMLWYPAVIVAYYEYFIDDGK